MDFLLHVMGMATLHDVVHLQVPSLMNPLDQFGWARLLGIEHLECPIGHMEAVMVLQNQHPAIKSSPV